MVNQSQFLRRELDLQNKVHGWYGTVKRVLAATGRYGPLGNRGFFSLWNRQPRSQGLGFSKMAPPVTATGGGGRDWEGKSPGNRGPNAGSV